MLCCVERYRYHFSNFYFSICFKITHTRTLKSVVKSWAKIPWILIGLKPYDVTECICCLIRWFCRGLPWLHWRHQGQHFFPAFASRSVNFVAIGVAKENWLKKTFTAKQKKLKSWEKAWEFVSKPRQVQFSHVITTISSIFTKNW